MLMDYAYPIQFAANAQEATARLVDLISTGACGYDRGVDHYLSDIKSLLRSEEAFSEKPLPEFLFTANEFRQILRDVVGALHRLKNTGVTIDRAAEAKAFDGLIAALSARLEKAGVRIFEHKYDTHAFGSWHLVAGTGSRRIHFAYEGKESYLRYRDAEIVPKDHRDFVHKIVRTWEGEEPLAFVEAFLVQEFVPGD